MRNFRVAADTRTGLLYINYNDVHTQYCTGCSSPRIGAAADVYHSVVIALGAAIRRPDFYLVR